MKQTLIEQIIADGRINKEYLIRGWLRTRRDAKNITFLEINDGSCLANLQAVLEDSLAGDTVMKGVSVGASLELSGMLMPSPAKGQTVELVVKEIHLLGAADPQTFPLQKKRHSEEFLRSIAHLRCRINRFGAMFRLRSTAALAIHNFFAKRHFHYIHTPILTASDCEGAGQMFRVSTPCACAQDHQNKEFFGRPAYLTVSGQLEAEALAMGLGRVYTFGPAFRAENSNTARHASEFWMVEPEMCFFDLMDNMNLAEEFIRSLLEDMLTHAHADLELFFRYIDTGLEDRLWGIVKSQFERITYTEAIKLLENAKKSFEHPVKWGVDLQTEHERWLAEEYFDRPVIVYDYPKKIKPFYMRINDDDLTVAAMDILLPRVGEIIGGSQREERLEILQERIVENNLSLENYSWYLDLRRFGSVEHSGFGLGFERFLMFLTGSGNIRDVIPFPRTPNQIDF